MEMNVLYCTVLFMQLLKLGYTGVRSTVKGMTKCVYCIPALLISCVSLCPIIIY